jgi:hypothetical protein
VRDNDIAISSKVEEVGNWGASSCSRRWSNSNADGYARETGARKKRRRTEGEKHV